MGIPVLIIGESGSGKSASLRNFEKNQVSIFNVAQKPLPFRKKLHTVDVPEHSKANDVVLNRYDFIKLKIKSYEAKGCKSFVIDDSQYLMSFDLFARAKETGYAKFTDMAVEIQRLIHFIIKDTNPDTIVYMLHHSETTEDGKKKAKTVGKMIDNQLTLEGLFSIVLLCIADKSTHCFMTQSDGVSTAKSPMEMFETLTIDNDLAMVDKTIRNYYNI